MIGLDWHENKNGFTVVRLHYLAHPDKTKEWAEKQQKSYPSIDVWRQEQELDFTKASGRRVFPEFRSDLHIRDLQYNPYADMWRGWDFGYHRPACIWAQLDAEERLLILDEELGYEEVIDQFALRVKKKHKLYGFKDACLLPNTLIITKKGIKRIDKVILEDEVLTHKNRFKKVKQIFKRDIDEIIIELHPRGQRGFPLRVTANHPVWADIRKAKRQGEKYFQPKWTYSGLLERNCYLFNCINKMDEVEVPQAFKKYIFDNYRIFGYFAGDGTSNNRFLAFSIGFSKKERPILEDLKKFCSLNKLNFRLDRKKNMYIGRIHNKVLATLFREYFYNSLKEKIIPDFLLNGKFFYDFLEGLFFTDGCYVKNSKEAIIGNISLQLLSKMKLRLDLDGIASNLYRKKIAGEIEIQGRKTFRKDYFHLIFATNDIKNLPKAKRTFDYLVKPISKVTKKYYVGQVYNLEVEEDNSYVANGIIVHNCDPAGKQVTDKGKDTSVGILKKMGVNPHMRPSRVEDGINVIRNLLLPRADGRPALLVHPRCKLLIDGFLGGYTRDEDDDEPVKDGYYDHLFDAVRYMINVIYDKKHYIPRKHTMPFIRIRKTAVKPAGY